MLRQRHFAPGTRPEWIEQGSNMVEIIYLSTRARARRSPVIFTGQAEILFFTGVRYQKYAEITEMAVWADPRDGARPTSNSRKRKRRA